MAPQNESTLALGQTRLWPQLKIGGLLGYAAIWAFFGVFLIYPLVRLFFDAVTTETGAFTLQNFYDFFTDSFYLKTLWNSILLGLGTVVTTSIIGITFAFLLLRYDFPGRGLFSYLSFVDRKSVV